MNLYYYSLSQKKFCPLYVHTAHKGELTSPQRYNVGTGGFITATIFAILAAIAAFVFWLAGLFVGGTGFLLDYAIQFTISSSLYQNLSVVNVAWTTVRDFSNMFFIFALLYVAIKTILGMAGGSTKRWVANIIIAAVLINFSLFATKVVIDAGNVLAMGFWDRMTLTTAAGTKNTAAEHLMQGLKLQTNFDLKDSNGVAIPMDNEKRILVYLGGTLVMLVAGYVFLAGAIMMIARTVTLIMLMIFSPFAFLSFALPVGGGFANKWISKLIANSFVAPAFLAMIYLDIIIINGLDLQTLTGSANTKLAGAFTGDTGSFPIIYNFIIVIMLMLASLTVASAVSSNAGEMGGKMAKRAIGVGAGVGLAGVAMGGRQIGGRAGKALSDNETLKKLAANKESRIARFAGNLGLASAEKMKKGTWDARNAGANKLLGYGGVSAGGGGKKSYETGGQALSSITKGYRGTEKEKELIDTAKARYATDPKAREAYLADRGVDLEAKRNKDANKELKSDLRTQENKTGATEKIKEYESHQQELKDGKITQDEFLKRETAVAADLQTLLKALTAKEKVDFLSEKQLTMAPVIKSLEGGDLSVLAAKSAELEPETIAAINAGIVAGGTESARKYMKNQTKVGGAFAYNAEANLTKLTDDYDEQKKALGGEKTEAFKAYAVTQRAEINKALGMLGGANEIKELSDTILVHEAVVSEYNGKIVRELTKKIADTDGANSQLAKDFEAKLKEHNSYTKNGAGSARDAAAERAAPKSRVIPMTPQEGTI